MATFNIYGCCICRDLFTFAENNTHEVIHFLQSSSHLINFYYNTKPKKEMTMDDFENIALPNFKKKCIINDYNKTFLDYYVEPSDFIILDLTILANLNLNKEIYKDGSVNYFTSSPWFANAYNAGLKDFFLESKLEVIDRFKIFEEIGLDIILDRFISWLKNDLHYREDQIIMIENFRMSNYVLDNKVYPFPKGNREIVNNKLAELYKSFKEKCRGCHTVKMPFGTYADGRHRWSLYDLHLCNEYYHYLYDCVDTIVEDSKTADEKIAQLREEYSAIFCQKLCSMASDTIGKQLLNGSLSADEDKYIAVPNSAVYNNPAKKQPVGKLSCYTNVIDFRFPYSKTADGYVDVHNCVKGVIGHEQSFNRYWKAINASTCVISNDHSITIRHIGNASKGQMNLIQTIENADELSGVPVTFSVWARVLQCSNNNGYGGLIGLINENNYNRGIFISRKIFTNTDWQRISITARLPMKESFFGLTVCLRANAGTGDEPQHAIVEFAKPKLEIGVVPTEFD